MQIFFELQCLVYDFVDFLESSIFITATLALNILLYLMKLITNLDIKKIFFRYHLHRFLLGTVDPQEKPLKSLLPEVIPVF